MSRTILSVGVEIPGGDADFVPFDSSRSLLDADIVLYLPAVPFGSYEHSRYKGKVCLSDDASFRARELIAHWRRELKAVLDAGKLVVIFLNEPEVVYAATGEKQYSGTGRNARTTRIVDEIGSYDVLPVNWRLLPASGSGMVPNRNAKFFLPFWAQFSNDLTYQAYISGDATEILLQTKSGDRVVGAFARVGEGVLIAVPPFDFGGDEFIEVRKKGGAERHYWTKKALSFGKRLISAVCEISSALASEARATPAPDWTKGEAFTLEEEVEIKAEIQKTCKKLLAAQEKKQVLEESLITAGTLRGLLYEQGKPLEKAVIEALLLFGFDAQNHNENGSEFDAVFASKEGRFLGEVEGKDTKAINIDKFSQLERNISEDFSREEVESYAKGVLFGNPFRLKPPIARPEPFTQKCLMAAKRLGVALVHTPDMFAPARYLKAAKNSEYAASCRRAIYEANGELVVFPAIPTGGESGETVHAS